MNNPVARYRFGHNGRDRHAVRDVDLPIRNGSWQIQDQLASSQQHHAGVMLRHKMLCKGQADATGAACNQIHATAPQPALHLTGKYVFGQHSPDALTAAHRQHHTRFFGWRFAPRSFGVSRFDDTQAQWRLLTRDGLRKSKHCTAVWWRTDNHVHAGLRQRLQQVQQAHQIALAVDLSAQKYYSTQGF